ncbi:DNA replication and repair protein RecF [Dyadobacter sp. CECT 9275]|uniref:DNA replication and repair protein RecF n=1 Tax=Dyadobacter helix TaxID=2822344 RepID=A0A916J8X9_9BACT|nr:AAA family ATPase [Dyadobacter sp. CECT 9275]CAG4991133.1 DNA replication and repair protein RecF [Dyadobacter sp. CECT 9275]
MKIEKLRIKNFKSLVDLEIIEPNPFSVFVGANGVGKSNIFEALEFFYYVNSVYPDAPGNPKVSQKITFQMFDGVNLLSFREQNRQASIELHVEVGSIHSSIYSTGSTENDLFYIVSDGTFSDRSFSENAKNGAANKLFKNFSRIFIGQSRLERINAQVRSNERLTITASNLEKVLKRLLFDENRREDMIDYLRLLIPEFERLEIHSDNIGGTDTLLIYEKGSDKPFNRSLISDGTYNILCLLTALYQSDEPQFLCIEEPENGLNPFVVKELVNLFRNACEEKGHYIWLNTHSQTLVEALTPDEIILVDKVNGETQVKQIKGMDLHGIPTDEAWFSGALGGGTPW